MIQRLQLFTIDAPLATKLSEDENEGSSSGSVNGAIDEDEDRQSALEISSDEDDAERPSISLPDDLINLRSPSPSRPSRKAKEKEPLWRDPADELVNIDLNGERRMRKLARGKGGDGKVGGKELEKRLRQQ